MVNRKVLLILAWALCTSFLLTSKAYAVPSSKRLQGSDRYKTAVAVSQEGWQEGSQYAVIATGEDFPDALSAVPLAKKYNAPVLLTEKYALNSDTAVELKRLKVKQVFIVGGAGVVSQDIENSIKLMGITPTRIAGVDRYDTSVKIADKVGISNGIFIVTGTDYFDALSVAPIAAKKAMPIVLISKDNVATVIKKYVSSKKDAKTYIINGDGFISDSVISQFPNAEIITENDKYERSLGIVKKFSSDIDFSSIYIATAADYADGLAGAALASKNSSALLFTEGSSLPDAIRGYIKSKVISEFNILGGNGAVSYGTESDLVNLPVQILSIYDISDTISENQQYMFPKTVTATKSDYTKEEVPVIWNLNSVNTSKTGTQVFEGTVKGYSGKIKLTLNIKPIISSVGNITAEVAQGDTYVFPSTVVVNYSDGSTTEMPVTWENKIINTGKVGTYTFQGVIEKCDKKASLALNVVEDSIVTFKDYNLERVIRRVTGKTNYSYNIYKSDVLRITSLYAANESITDLTGIEALTNLTSVELGGNWISVITPLQKLTGLNTLKLNSNNITDITPLQSLTRLKNLNLSYNRITSIAPLKNLTGLTSLYLYSNSITDYSPVKQYYNNIYGKDFTI